MARHLAHALGKDPSANPDDKEIWKLGKHYETGDLNALVYAMITGDYIKCVLTLEL